MMLNENAKGTVRKPDGNLFDIVPENLEGDT